MDDLVAESAILRARHLHSTPTALHLDAIPPLTRPLAQVQAQSTRLLSARIAAPPSSTHPTPAIPSHTIRPPLSPAALRLFARLHFDPYRLHHAITHIQSVPTFLDRPANPISSHSHLSAVPPRAAHDALLRANRVLRLYAARLHRANLSPALDSLLTNLRPLLPPRTSATSTSRSTPPPSERPHTSRPSLSNDPRYIHVVTDIALHVPPRNASSLLHDAAVAARDAPHFVQMLAVVATVARFTSSFCDPALHFVAWGARVVLEDLFAHTVPALPVKPRLAPVSAVVAPITDYVRALHRNVSAVGGGRNAPTELSVWAIAFYCMRVGHLDAALHVFKMERGRREHVATIVPLVEAFLKGRQRLYAQCARPAHRRGERAHSPTRDSDPALMEQDVSVVPGCLTQLELYERLEMFYREKAWPSDDPYMRACCVVLMRLELLAFYGASSNVRDVASASAPHPPYPARVHAEKCSLPLLDSDASLLFASVEDYLWLRLWLCRTPVEYDHMPPSSSFTFVHLPQVGDSVIGCGSAHFDPNNTSPLLYPFALVCCGRYEHAVSYLTSHTNEQLMHPGMHLGIALYNLGWIHDDAAFHQLMSRYVNMFAPAFPTEAALYLLTLRDRDTVRRLLRDLVVSSGEYAILLGSGAADADQEEPGALAGLVSAASTALPCGLTMDDVVSIRIETARVGAAEAASREEFATAANLYRVANQLAQSVDMSMRALAQVVYKGHSPSRSLAVADALRHMQALQSDSNMAVSDLTRRTLKVLLQMADFFQDFWMGRYQAAWGALRYIDALPLTISDVSICQSVMEAIGDRYHSCVRRCLEELVKTALHIAKFALEHDSVSGLANGKLATASVDSSHLEANKQRLPNAEEVKSLCIFAGWMRLSDPLVDQDLVRIELLLT